MTHPKIVEAATAMREFIETPFPNATNPSTAIDLREVYAGSLGDIWKYLALAAARVLLSIEPSEEALNAAVTCDRGPRRRRTVGDVILAEYRAMQAELRKELGL